MGLNKVIIRVYTDKNTTTVDSTKSFTLPINPEQYSQNFRLEYDSRRGHGRDGSSGRYKSTAPEELRLEFVFDGTNTVQGYAQAGKTVKIQIKEFLGIVYYLDGKVHRPRLIQINWGDYLVFPCYLTNLDINYTLFEEDGDPLRAKLNCTFNKYLDREISQRQDRNSSPDLTHLRLVQPGERLDLMTYEIYNDPKYVLQIAQANGLTSFRNIKSIIGQEVQFPPLQKDDQS
jgi:hypothetical protein